MARNLLGQEEMVMVGRLAGLFGFGSLCVSLLLRRITGLDRLS